MNSKKYDYGKIIWLGFFLIFFAFYIRFSNAAVTGTSMIPTLKEKEILLVDKWSYKKNKPQYGDLLVFQTNDNGRLIKRVIGLPGDYILIKNNRIYRNDILLEESYLDDHITNGFIKMQVPDDEYFVLGDNRINSLDSRSAEIGTVSFSEIIGKAIFSYKSGSLKNK